MALNPWYKVATLRKEVREGRSFSPDEFAIALEQVVAGTAPADKPHPAQFLSRTCLTRALREHSGMVLRRLEGDTANTAPVLTLVTQFGGGKTHTLTSLYHIANAGPKAFDLPGVGDLLREAGLSRIEGGRVGVFVGNAWDPAEGRETPWIDLARQVAGDEGVAALGTASASTAPGTEAIGRVIALADAPVLFLFDEVLNFVNRHRGMAESFHAFIQNLTVAVTGATGAAAVISLPRSQVEMTDWDQQWQERITKVVRRVAKDLIANDEAEIGEVVRRRLFADLGNERIRNRVAKTHADWCFERTVRLPAEWLAVDTASTEAKAREALKNRFKACYPFHPTTLSVFHRKWRALAQFQQTRGALAMLAQWVSWAARRQFTEARTEALITLGSAPLHAEEFRAVVLGQLGEAKMDAAIAADIAGEAPHARALDADTRGALRDIHRRVGSAILFESSGGQVDKVAHLPELRFALGEPDVETTTVDNAAAALEAASFFIRRVGADGYRIHHQATLRKVVSDRRASLDDEAEIRPAVRKLVETEFKRNAALRLIMFPEDGAAIPDSPRLTLAVADPSVEWSGTGDVIERLERWTTHRGESPRLYPGALVWCVRKPGRELRDRVELWLAWKRVRREVADGILGTEFDRSDRSGVDAKVRNAEEEARDEVWGGYRYVLLADRRANDGLRVIDLGAGHSSPSDTLSGRVVRALKTDALLNESVGAGYIERHWPPAFRDSGAWPLASLRKSFLDGSLTRLVDADAVLHDKIPRFVANGDFGLASGARDDGGYDRLWYRELLPPEEMAFEADVFLLTRAKAEELTAAQDTREPSQTKSRMPPEPQTGEDDTPRDQETGAERTEPEKTTLRLVGDIPPELWNRFGTRVLPKLRTGEDLSVRIDSSVLIAAGSVENLRRELHQALEDLGLAGHIRIEHEQR